MNVCFRGFIPVLRYLTVSMLSSRDDTPFNRESPQSQFGQLCFPMDQSIIPKLPMHHSNSSASSSGTVTPDSAYGASVQSLTSSSSRSSWSDYYYYDDDDSATDDELMLPSYDASSELTLEPVTTQDSDPSEPIDDSVVPAAPSQSQIRVADDSSVEAVPLQNVDFFSHQWTEEDIWTSWRYITTHRNAYENGARLENAAWRTWAKYNLSLETVSSTSLNWFVPFVPSLPSQFLTFAYTVN